MANQSLGTAIAVKTDSSAWAKLFFSNSQGLTSHASSMEVK